MKTTIDVPDAIFRQVKARASLRGKTMKTFFTEALIEKLQRERGASTEESGWMKVFGKISEAEIEEVQAQIDAEFSVIEAGAWE